MNKWKRGHYKSLLCSSIYNYILITPCKLYFHWTCDKNNFSVPPMVCTVIERNNCCGSIFVPDACDRGHKLFCQKRQQPANSHQGWWALEAPFTCVQHLTNMMSEKHGRNQGRKQFTDWYYFRANSNSMYWTHAIIGPSDWTYCLKSPVCRFQWLLAVWI